MHRCVQYFYIKFTISVKAVILRAIRNVSRDDDWVVKVIGCKPIGFPGVGSSPTHLKLLGLMFFFKLKNVSVSPNSLPAANHFSNNLSVVWLNNLIKLNFRLFTQFDFKEVINNQKNFLNIICSVNSKVNFFFYVNKFIFFFKKPKISVKRQPAILIILESELNKTVSSLVRSSNLCFKSINLATDYNKNIYPLLINIASTVSKEIYFSFVKYFFYKSFEVRKTNQIKKFLLFFRNFKV